MQETNEANNQLIVPVTVAPGNVNLVVVANSFSVNPSSIKRFSSATATVTVKNVGTFPAGSFTVQWFPTQSTGGAIQELSAVDSARARSVTLTYKATYFQAAGPYTSKIVDRSRPTRCPSPTVARTTTSPPRR